MISRGDIALRGGERGEKGTLGEREMGKIGFRSTCSIVALCRKVWLERWSSAMTILGDETMLRWDLLWDVSRLLNMYVPDVV